MASGHDARGNLCQTKDGGLLRHPTNDRGMSHQRGNPKPTTVLTSGPDLHLDSHGGKLVG